MISPKPLVLSVVLVDDNCPREYAAGFAVELQLVSLDRFVLKPQPVKANYPDAVASNSAPSGRCAIMRMLFSGNPSSTCQFCFWYSDRISAEMGGAA